MRTAALILAFILGISRTSLANQDYVGDVHPVIMEEDGNFAVYFKNNEQKKKTEFKTVVDSEGKVLSERQPAALPLVPSLLLRAGGLDGLVETHDNAYFVVPTHPVNHKGKPFVLKIDNESSEKTELDWGEEKIEMIHSFAVCEDLFVLAASALSPETKNCSPVFAIHVFLRQEGKRLHSIDIGTPVRSWFFPHASKVVLSGRQAYVAWMRGERKNCTLLLSRVNLDSGALDHGELCAGEVNTSVSLGIIGQRLLVAFHGFQKTAIQGHGPRGCKIILRSLNLKDAFEKDK